MPRGLITKTAGKHYQKMVELAKSKKFPNEKVFCENSTYCRKHLKKRILDDNLLEYKCIECGNIGEWNGKELVLQLDHINGDKFDNRLENLRFLCPNCHTQTETYSRGQSKKRNQMRYKELKELS